MGDGGTTLNVRLSADLAAKFNRLAIAIPGLPKGVILRLILSSALDRPIDEQIRTVTEQLLDPSAKPKAPPLGGRMAHGNTRAARAT
jgi:hypothetical protein